MQTELIFQEESTEKRLERRIDELEKSLHKVRKALFARHGELAKMYVEIHQDHEAWKATTCRNAFHGEHQYDLFIKGA